MPKRFVIPSFLTGIFFACIFLSCRKADNPQIQEPPPYANDATASIVNSDSATTVYITGGRSANLFAINAKNGLLKWKVTLGGAAFLSPIYTRGKVITAASDNKVYAYDTSGNLAWTYTLANNVSAAPISDKGVIFIADKASVYALDSRDGSLKWKFTECGAGYLTYSNNTIYFNTNYLYAIDAETGTKKWQNFTNGGNFPVVSGDKVYCFRNDWTMMIVNAATGALLFTGGGYDSYNDLVQFNVKYGNIYVLRYYHGVTVTDAADPTKAKFGMPYASVNISPSISPILADSLAIFTWAVSNAITGEDLYVIPAGPIESNTYYNHTIYCVTWQKVTMGGTAGYYYATVFALDAKLRTILWVCNLEGEDFRNVEPCVVTESGVAYRGGFDFR